MGFRGIIIRDSFNDIVFGLYFVGIYFDIKTVLIVIFY